MYACINVGVYSSVHAWQSVLNLLAAHRIRFGKREPCRIFFIISYATYFGTSCVGKETLQVLQSDSIFSQFFSSIFAFAFVWCVCVCVCIFPHITLWGIGVKIQKELLLFTCVVFRILFWCRFRLFSCFLVFAFPFKCMHSLWAIEIVSWGGWQCGWVEWRPPRQSADMEIK